MIQIPTVIALLGLTLMHASAQTLYYVPETDPSQSVIRAQSLSISVGGTNTNGATTYIEVFALTSEIVVEPSRTVTEISVPTTFTQTLVADASVQTLLAGDVVETCGFGADGRGTCVETITHVQTLAASTATENLAITFSGSVVPFYTLPAVPSAAQRSAGRVKSWIVLLGILVAVLHAL